MSHTTKQKKPLTATQKMHKYRAIQYVSIGGEYISVLTPYIILGAINFQDWFVSEDGWKIGLGASMALALGGIAVWLITKKKENKEITNGWITLVIAWFAVAFIFVLLQSIIDQIAVIMLYGGLGLLGALGLEIVSNKSKARADAYKVALGDIKQTSIAEEVKKEVEEEKKQQPTE